MEKGRGGGLCQRKYCVHQSLGKGEKGDINNVGKNCVRTSCPTLYV